jgi:hypothetical protein
MALARTYAMALAGVQGHVVEKRTFGMWLGIA